MKFINYPIIYLAVSLSAGTLCAHLFETTTSAIYVLIGSALVFLLALIVNRNRLHKNVFFGMIAYFSFFVLGYFNYQSRLPQFQPKHYSNIRLQSNADAIQLKITEVLKPDSFNDKYLATAEAINGESTCGKILLSIAKDSISKLLAIDNKLLISAKLTPFPKPLNPNQFDYGKYMKTLGVYHQLRVNKKEILKTSLSAPTLLGRAEQLRNNLIFKLEKTPIEADQRAIIQALLLGQKRDIRKELTDNYAAAGAIHILAISGLHVGILFLILNLLLKPVLRLPYGKTIVSLTVVLVLWSFAFIAGLSPSVTRAVTMFSFFAFAESIRRQTSTISTLALSFFILLLVNPLWLFHVGFQLSYLAVLSILLIHPKLSKLYRPHFYLDRLLWNTLTVSIAAQIGIVPLSLYYFHQFPGLFFLTNIMVLPFLGILLGCGLLLLLLVGLNALPDEFAHLYNYLIGILNDFIEWVAMQDEFLIKDVHFSSLKVIASYFFLITLLLLWRGYNSKNLQLFLIGFGFLIAVFIYDKNQTSINHLIVFQKSRQSLIGFKQNEKLVLFGNDSLQGVPKKYPIKSYLPANAISEVSLERAPSVLKYKQETILILDSLGVYPKLSEVDIVLLTYSPKLNLDRLIDSLKPQRIIADGSNYKSYVKRWQQTCKNKKLPFYHTGTKGALIIE